MSNRHRFLLQTILAYCVFFPPAISLQIPESSCFRDPENGLFSARYDACHLDDNAKPTSWPWTHRPRCVDITAATDTKYCVYTSATHGRNGLSIVTTPEVAADVVQLLAKPYELPPLSHLSPVYDVVDVPGKGKGVVANTLIPALSVIMIDYAAVLVDNRLAASADEASMHYLKGHAVQQLRNPDKVLGLSTGSTSNTDPASAVLAVNSFGLDLQDIPHSALFPDVAVSCAMHRRQDIAHT